jgi:dienelactone hydrolase
MEDVSSELSTRRQVVASLGTAGVGLLAGCSGNNEETANPSESGRETQEGGSEIDDPENSNSSRDGEQSDDGNGSDNDGQQGEDSGAEYTLAFDHPDAVLPDDPFEMTISGLPADEPVKIRVGEAGRTRSATAIVQTDTNGQLDLEDTTVVGGDVPQDLGVPLPVALHQFVNVSYDPIEIPGTRTARYTVTVDGQEAGSTTVSRRHPGTDMSTALSHDELVGEVFKPAEGETGPGVILLHGSGGGYSLRYRAGLLARQGFTALALKYIGAPGLPEKVAEIPLEYVQTAIEWFLDHDAVASSQVGLLGISKGAELALLAGSQFETVGAVVSLSGSGVVWQGISARTSSWMLDGDPVPYVPFVDDGWDESFRAGYTNSFEAASESEIQAATIPVEEISASVLLISGTADSFWNAERLHRVAEQRLAEQGHPSYDHLVYDDVGHDIVPRYRPLPVSGMAGSESAAAEASHDHWPHVLETLSAIG